MPDHVEHGLRHDAPYWLRRLGVTSWLALGTIALLVVAFGALGAISGVVIPLIIAIILGVLFQPLVNLMDNRGVPRTLATVVAMALAFIVLFGMASIVVSGFVQQIPEIGQQLAAGWASMREWLASFELDAMWLEAVRDAVQHALPGLGQGLAGALGSTFSSAASFLLGSFFALFFLFFVLRDGVKFADWLTRNVNLRPELTREIVADSAASVRGYFRGTAITAALTSFVVAIPLLLLDVPLVIPILVLYFFTSFIPYVGGFIAGAFAVVIAFGSGGAQTALLILLAVLISNGSIQSAISSWALGSSLDLHPVAVLLATMIGGAIAGIVGMTLGAPILAIMVRATARLRHEGVLTES